MSKTKEERAAEYAQKKMRNARYEHKLGVLYGALDGYKDGYTACSSIKDKELSALQDQLRWRSVEEELPPMDEKASYSQVPCLVIWEGYVSIKVFNHEHECWDQEDGDDYCCDINGPTHWLPIPRKEEQ